MKITRVAIFYRNENTSAKKWEAKILNWLKRNYPEILVDNKNPQALLVLGGDGTIIEAVKKYATINPVIIGLNLGHVGFLASTRKEANFLIALQKLIKGDFLISKRMLIKATVERDCKKIFSTNALNEVTAQNMLGMVELEVMIDNHSFQYVRGSGLMVSTATGATGFNLSAHGPVVMPDIKCMIVTELLDHNTPTPSLVVKRNKKIQIKILNFRKQGLLALSATKEPVDVLLVADGVTLFPLQKGDVITVERSNHLVKCVEFEQNYFLKSLKEKFGYR